MARVLLVTNDWPPDRGGIQTYLTEVVERTGHEVRVLAPHHPDALSDQRVRRHQRWRFMLPTRQVANWVAGQAEEWGAELIWYGAPHPPALLRDAGTGIPYLVLCHGAETVVGSAIPGVRWWLRRSLRGAAAVLAVSEFTRARVEAFSGRGASRLGVGIDREATPASTDRPPLNEVVCVSRLVPRKGQHRLIDGLATIDASWRPSLRLVGSGRMAARLERRARRKGVEVTIESGLSDAQVAERYRSALAFAMPARSRWLGLEVEGLGIVYLEAATRGLPVIAGRSGGAPETIVPGVTGLLAESAREVGAAIQGLLDDPDRARRMGAAGREFVGRRYAWPDVISRFDATVTDAVEGA